MIRASFNMSHAHDIFITSWHRKNGSNTPNIPGVERETLLSKRAKLKELVDCIERAIEISEDKSTISCEWLEKLIRKTLRSKKEVPVVLRSAG